MKATDLRKSILQAAVQGKLVPQDKNDEPASDLLKRIQAEKVALIKDGKLKKEKPLPSITEDEIPYDLPDGWIWCRINEFIYYTDAGKSPACINRPAIEAEWGVVKTTAVQQYVFWENENKALPERFSVDKRMRIECGDILITRAGPKNRTGIACLVENCTSNLILSDKTVRINCSGVILFKPYIVITLNSLPVRSMLIEKMTGMAESQVNISQSNIAAIPFPLPPLAEQQRIVAKVDELMAMCDELEAAEKELDTLETHFTEYLPKSILQSAVQGKLVPQDKKDEFASELLKRIQVEKAKLVKEGKLKKEKHLPPITEDEIPYDLPEGWVWCRLGDMTCLIMGQSPDGGSVSETCDGIEFHQGKSFYSDKYLLRSNVFTSQPTKIAPPYSVLLAVRAPVGAVNITQREICVGRGLCAVVSLGTVTTDFVFYWLRALEKELTSKATGTTFVAVTGDVVSKQLVPLPPLAEQQRIVAKVNELIALCDELKHVGEHPIDHGNVVPFPSEVETKGELLLMAAQGKVAEKPSQKHAAALDDLLGMMDDV